MPDRTLPATLRDEVERLGKADIMVGIPSHRSAATIGYVVRAAQAGLVQYFPDLRPVVVNADAGSPDDTQRVVVETEPPDYVERILLVRPRNRLQRISLTYPEVDGVGGKGAALRAIFGIAAELGVEALVVVDSDLRSIVPEWIELLAGPILKGGFDFVAPLYQRFKWDGTATNVLTYPLTRALYGLRIRQPNGGDFGLSGDLVRHLVDRSDWTADVSRFGVDAWMTTSAIAGGFAVCQARLGAKVHDPREPGADLGPMFSQVAGTVFRLANDHADRWLGVETWHDVPAYGFERFADPPPVEMDVRHLLDELIRGRLAFGDEWRAMLSSQCVEAILNLCDDAERSLEALTRPDGAHTAERSSFHFPDDVWARVVCDVLLAVHAGTAEIDRLVAALVPLYAGRVASFVLETRELSWDGAEEVVERGAAAFELAKPGLVRRWRTLDTRPSAVGTPVGDPGTQRPEAAGGDRRRRGGRDRGWRR